MTKTLTLTRDQIEKIQVPEGMRADILTQMLDVTFRGPASQLETLTAEDVTATVDLPGQKPGAYTLPCPSPSTVQTGLGRMAINTM